MNSLTLKGDNVYLKSVYLNMVQEEKEKEKIERDMK